MKRLWLLILAALLSPSALYGQAPKPMTIAELVTYAGKDREQLLYAGAKAEGKVTWYTSLAGSSYKAMVKAFESKYPGVGVEAYRVSGSDMTVHMMDSAAPAYDCVGSAAALTPEM